MVNNISILLIIAHSIIYWINKLDKKFQRNQFFRNLENTKTSGGSSSTDYIDLGMEIIKSVAEVDETLGPLIFVSYSSSIFFVSLALYAFSTLYFTGSFKWQALLFSIYFLVQGGCDT